MSLADRPRLRLLTLCLLYVAQGIPWGFMATTLPGYLVARGLDFGFVSATLSFTTLPYTFKWVWGPIMDAFPIPRFGRRRGWIVLAQAMMAITVIAIVTIPDLATEIRLLAWMILIHTVFNAMQDVAVDALAADLLSDAERGRANGLMYASKYVGGFVGGATMATWIALAGLETALVVQTTVLVLIMFVPLVIRERAGAPPARVPARVIARALGQAFSLRSAIFAALLMLAGSFALGMTAATGYPLVVGALKWLPEDYAKITGGWVLAIGCVAAGVTGFLADRYGRRRVATLSAVALAIGWIGFALLRDAWTSRALIYAFGFYQGGFAAVFTVALIVLAMDLSWPKIAGSQFAAYMALTNFSMTLGYQFAATANELWEFHGVYIAAGVMQLAIIPLLIPIDPQQTRRELTDASPIRWLGIGALLALLVFLVKMTAYVTAKRLGYL